MEDGFDEVGGVVFSVAEGARGSVRWMKGGRVPGLSEEPFPPSPDGMQGLCFLRIFYAVS